MKLNAVRDFSTGIYDYNVMTSTFLRTKPGWPVSKVSFSSQEWCGHVWHQIVPREGRVDSVSHSYFDGEADGAETLEMPEGGRTLTFAIEARPPYRVVRQTGPDGEELALLGSARLAYWKLNTPGAESYLEQIGLGGD